MKKKILLSGLVASILVSSSFASEVNEKSEIEKLKAEISALSDQVSSIKKATGNDNIKWDVDFRTSSDFLSYETASGKKLSNDLITNKLTLGMVAQPSDNLVFRGSLESYKLFGQNQGTQNAPFQEFDWYGNRTPSDNGLGVKDAYFIWFTKMTENVPFALSIGRRPGVDGQLTNLRENTVAGSPNGHNVNLEFDGASLKWDLDKVTDVKGLWVKLCLLRTYSNADGVYSNYSTNMARYTKNDVDTPSMNVVGLFSQLYDNGQYQVTGNLFKAMDVIGFENVGDSMAERTAMGRFTSTGNIYGAAFSVKSEGVLEGINDYLDDTTIFASVASSKTDPKGNSVASGYRMDGTSSTTTAGTVAKNEMLGSSDSKVGYSLYLGAQMPGVEDNDRWGVEYNKGSKYWRSFTYGEDTLIGSKLAARGSSYEVYYTKPIVNKNLTAQVRYTYIDYDYTGSNGFFDNTTGTPYSMAEATSLGLDPVEKAQDIRVSIKYTF
jgi:hypothetical protein